MINRPLPILDVESRPYWEACNEGRLLLQKCGETFQFPPTHYCTNSPRELPEWVEVSGKGAIYSWIVVHVGIPRDIYGDQTPYITALLTLAEGPRICANIVDVDPADLRDGLEVEVFFERVANGSQALPFFRPARA